MAAVGRVLVVVAIILTHTYLPCVKADCQSDLAKLPRELVRIHENTPAGDVILNVTTHSDVIMIFENNSPSNFITFRDGSIVARINISLDWPENQDNCKKASDLQPVVKVSCQNDGNPVDVNFKVTITDDYSPTVVNAVTAVGESREVGFKFLLLENITTDPDCNNQFFYSIDVCAEVTVKSNSCNEFPATGGARMIRAVQSNSREYFDVDNPSNQLVIKRQLDFELQTEHLVNLTVRSNVQGPTGYKTSSATVTVKVMDEDDMSPVFDVSHFVLHVTEGQNVSSVWLTATPPILARDGDVGINMSLLYRIDSMDPGLALGIHNETGDVRILELLDRERVPVYTGIVKAAQVDLSYKSVTGTLTILVDDINDNPPLYTSLNHVTITEDAPNGRQVMELTGYDIDEGPNAEFSFVIESDSIGAFGVSSQPELNRTYLVVRNSTALRGQFLAYVMIQLKEKMTGSCDFSTNCVANVTVSITDVNDHTPVFDSGRYEFSLSSNISGHVVVGQVKASDADKGDNAVIMYILSNPDPGDCSKLVLDAVTGEITTHQQLPAGVFCSWIVTACDSPADTNSRRCSSAYMSVTVVPSGSVAQQNVTVLENVPIGALVTYMAVKGLQTSSLDFGIQNDVLYTKVPLDREQQDTYLVPVQSAQNATATVININVNIEDVNDNAPVFEHPVYIINLNIYLNISQILLQVNATDKDTGNNSQFAFSLVTGTEYFDLHPRTGQIKLVKIPIADRTEYQLLVTDFGQPPLTGIATLRVYSTLNNETATLILPVGRDELVANREDVAKKLSSILGVVVRIYNIESLGQTQNNGSKLYISSTSSSSGQPISLTELKGLLEMHAIEIYNKFAKPREVDGPTYSGRLTDLEIALICVSVILFLVVLLVMLLCYRSQKRYKQSLRLFDTLHKDTAIYDNPRKPSSTAAVIATNGSTNAQRMLARLSNGSVGHSSMTNLIPNKDNGNNIEITPPTSGSSERRQIIPPHYENVVLSSEVDELVHHNSSSAPPSSVLVLTSENCSNHVQPDLNEGTHFEMGQDLQTTEAGGHDNTNKSSNESSTDADDNIPNKDELQTAEMDADDEEVAHILSETNSHDVSPSVKDDDLAVSKPSLDLMTTLTPMNSHPDNSVAAVNNPALDNTDILLEPEPDYAKKVRFSEAKRVDTIENSEAENSNTSLGKFLSQQGVTSRLSAPSTNTSTIDDSIEELTAL